MKSKLLKNKYFYLATTGLILIPTLIIVIFYQIASNTGLEGKRGGPQDAFRHIYASAVVARYVSPKFVVLVTLLAERDTSSPYDQMDIHNNRLGIMIAESEVKSLYKEIFNRVKEAEVKPTDHSRVYILEESRWQKSDF